MTTYMNIDAANRRVEIGSTWYRKSVQRSSLNRHFDEDNQSSVVRQQSAVTADVAAWISDHDAPLPSGADASKSQPEMAVLWGSKRSGQASVTPRSE